MENMPPGPTSILFVFRVCSSLFYSVNGVHSYILSHRVNNFTRKEVMMNVVTTLSVNLKMSTIICILKGRRLVVSNHNIKLLTLHV